MNQNGSPSPEEANLLLRQRNTKPILKYNTRGVSTTPATSPAMRPRSGARVMSSAKPPAVPLFNQSDLQYLKQQVSTFASPSVATNLFGASSSSFAYRPQLLSAYTFLSSNSATANFMPSATIATPSPLPAPPTSRPSNPYARPLSAKDLQSQEQMYVTPATLIGTSVVRRSNSSGCIPSHGAHPTAITNTTTTNTPVIQTNSFLRPQSAFRSDSRLTRSNSRTSVIPANGHQTIVVETRPCAVIDREERTSESSTSSNPDSATSNKTGSMMPRPPSAAKSTFSRPSFVNPKTDGKTRPFDNLNVSPPRDTETVTPTHPTGTKASSVSSKRSDNHIVRVPTATSFQMPTPMPVGKPPAPKSNASSQTSSSSTSLNSPAKIRNLNYTPTKPYSEVCDPVNNGETEDCDEPSDVADQTPVASNSNSSIRSTPEKRTTYYRKGSKAEEILHDLSRRPKADGAPCASMTNEKQALAPAAEEWEDVDEDNDSDFDPDSERVPGDGEDYDENFDDDDDVMDGLDDDLDGASDEDSDALSLGSSARGGRTPVRIRSATKRLLGLSIKDKPASTTTRSRPPTGKSRPVSALSTVSSSSDLHPSLTPSLFSNIPPTVNFVRDEEKVEQLPWEIRKLLKWRMSPITPNVVKNAIARSGFRASKKNNDWLGYWGKHMKSQGFKAIREYQKVNHFPGSFQIGRKDRLWRNLSKMQVHFGKKEFSFFPQTFVLPYDLKLLKRTWEDGGNKQKWIIKPPASARGIGIKVIHKWNQIPRRRPVIVQKYLARPYLINDSKFDLRIYVYVTSYDPLRIYIYDDGLVRFASMKYSSSLKNLNNRYMHLTNYSINKKNNEFQANDDEGACQGHKWTMKALWGYLKKRGVDTNRIWDNIIDLIIKTVICSEACVNSCVKANVKRKYSCHELFGFDVMLDDQLKPWIIEVNISPSLHSNSQLDMSVKGGMIKDLLNLAGFMIPDKHDIYTHCLQDNSRYQIPPEICIDKRMYPSQIAPDERAKHAYYCQRHNDEMALSTILDILTPDDVRCLAETLDEDSRRGNMLRAFPSSFSHKYLRFFEQPRYQNILLDVWVQRYLRMEARGISLIESLCQRDVHLENPTEDLRHQWAPPSSTLSREPRVVSAPGMPLKFGAGSSLPTLRKKKLKSPQGSLGSLTATPLSRQSANRSAFNSSEPTRS